jgi:spermidine/putrescine transport system permease protein
MNNFFFPKNWKQRFVKNLNFYLSWSYWWLVPYFLIAGFLIFLPILLAFLYIFLEKTNQSDLLRFTFSKINFFLQSGYVIISVVKSLLITVFTIVVSLILGYPIALWMSRLTTKTGKNFCYLIMSLPIWINLLVRVIGLEILFEWLDLKLQRQIFIGTIPGVITAMVWLFLPLAILPIYQSLIEVDPLLVEVSQDLGASELQTFWKITFRYSIHGMATAIILMLPMIMGALTIPRYIGKGKVAWIGNLIETYFKQNEDFSLIILASIFLALILLIISLLVKKTANRIWTPRGIKYDQKFF